MVVVVVAKYKEILVNIHFFVSVGFKRYSEAMVLTPYTRCHGASSSDGRRTCFC